MSVRMEKLSAVLKQYRIEHWVQDHTVYKQVSILNDGSVVLRGEKIGKEIGRKRQFVIDLDEYPNTLIFTRQLLLQGCIGMPPKMVNQCIVTENMPMFSVEGVETDYLSFFLKSELFKSQVRSLKTTGTAQKSLHERQFLELEIPLPSRKRQLEIVQNIQGFNQKLQVIATEIDQQQTYLQLLRQSFLQEAVQGELTKQDAADEPASELLKRIKTEKQKLIKEGKLKKEKELPPVIEDGIRFELPKGWLWCKFEEIKANKQNALKAGPFGSSLKKQDYTPSGYKIYGQEQVIADDWSIGDYYISKKKFEELKSCEIQPGDILVSLVGTIGKVLILPPEVEPGIINPRLVKFSLFKEINREYIKLMFNSPFIKNHLGSISHGGTMNILNLGLLRNILLPLPPIPEQQRIVTKVRELQQQLAALETQVQQSRQYAQQLLQAVLKEAFEVNKKEYAINKQLTMAAEE